MARTPILSDGRRRLYNIDEIWTGESGTGDWVPEVDDLVYDLDAGFFKVTDVNSTTYLSELVPWDIPALQILKPEDVIVGELYNEPNQRQVIRLDRSVTPYILDVDPTLRVHHSDASYAKVFLGVDVTENGTVISQLYNQSGDYIGENIPIEVDGGSKRIQTAYTNYDLDDNDIVTVVIYSTSGNKLLISQHRVQNTGFVRKLEETQKTISSISLDSPFINITEPTELVVPSNVQKDSLMLTAKITYTDGSSIRRNIDGSKVSLFGLTDTIPNIPGTSYQISLVYVLGADEAALETVYGAHENGHVTQSYTLRVLAIDTSYSAKLYVVPNWLNATEGYKLEYFLFNLDRGGYFYATPYVVAGNNSTPFDPLRYNQTQSLSISVNLSHVDPSLPNYTFAQSFKVSLLDVGTAAGTSWTINYGNTTATTYGTGLEAVVSPNNGDWVIDIDNGETLLSGWLARVYDPILPLFNINLEAEPPQPTHFLLEINGLITEYEIANWDNQLPSETAGVPGKAVTLHWIRKVNDTDLYLGASGLKIRHS